MMVVSRKGETELPGWSQVWRHRRAFFEPAQVERLKQTDLELRQEQSSACLDGARRGVVQDAQHMKAISAT
jgi:hypothetical protein